MVYKEKDSLGNFTLLIPLDMQPMRIRSKGNAWTS